MSPLRQLSPISAGALVRGRRNIRLSLREPDVVNNASVFGVLTSELSEREEVLHEVGFLLIAEAESLRRIVPVDDVEQGGCAAVVEVRRMLPHTAERRRAPHLRGGA